MEVGVLERCQQYRRELHAHGAKIGDKIGNNLITFLHLCNPPSYKIAHGLSSKSAINTTRR